MSRAIAALASRVVGRRVRLKCGAEGTVSRVTAGGLTVAIPNVKREDIAEWLD